MNGRCQSLNCKRLYEVTRRYCEKRLTKSGKDWSHALPVALFHLEDDFTSDTRRVLLSGVEWMMGFPDGWTAIE